MRLLALCSLLVAGLALAQDPPPADPAVETPPLAVPAPEAAPAAEAPPAEPPPAEPPRALDGALPRASATEAGLDPDALAKLEAYLFARNGDDTDRRGQRTNAFVLMKGGKVVVERYARETTAETPLLTWSVSKSVTATLVGVAVGEGLIELDAPAARWVPELDGPGHRDIKVRDLLNMSSGLAWNETYEAEPFTSSALAMLYGRGRFDMPAYAARHRLKYPPGTVWAYSSGDTNLLAAVLRAAVGEERWASWPYEALFDRIGMKGVVVERDARGNLVGSSYVYAPALAMARWGQLMLQDGVWEGQRVLPEGWVGFMRTLAPAYLSMPVVMEHYEDNPGAQIYLNVGDPARKIPPPWPDLPADAFAALGHWGKSVYVIPSWDMVVVRMGDDRVYGCTTWGQEGCEPDRTRAFTRPYFMELLAATVPGGGDGQSWAPLPPPLAQRQKGDAAAADTLNFAPVPSVYHAKEMCSCLFVEGRSEQSCADYVRQSTVPVKDVVVDAEKKTVRASSLGVTSTARYKGQREGCGLDLPPTLR